jgi:hypothetical protein
MCSINHDLRAIYFHIPKVGGLYVEKVLEKFYNFKTFYFTANNHKDYNDNLNNNLNDNLDNNLNDNLNDNQNDKIILDEYLGFLNIRNKGIYRYFTNSKNFNYISNMNDEKWETYKKFTFVRNPYERYLSAYKFLKLHKKNIFLEDSLLKKNVLNNYEYFHIIISQYEHLINENNCIDFNYIGKFENLNEELINILQKIGINEFKHLHYIENNITINSSKDNEKKKEINILLDNKIIILINKLFENDFKYFNYTQYNSYDDYILNYRKIDIKEQNKDIIRRYSFTKPILYLSIQDENNKYIKNDRPSKIDIQNYIQRNIFCFF